MMGRANSRMEATPKMHSATMVIRVVAVVQIVRPRLSRMEMFVTSSLGVEGMDRETILTALRRAGATFEGEEHPVSRGELTKTDLYELGLSGGPDSAHKRRNLLRRLSLPENLSAKAMFQVLQALYTRQELAGLLEET